MHRNIAGFFLLTALLCAAPAAGAPTRIHQQGRMLSNGGTPLEGSHTLTFSLHDAETGGNEIWTEEITATFDQGYYSVTLGDQTPLGDLLFATDPVWLGLAVDSEALSPRQEVVSVPYALRASTAEHLAGGLVDAGQISVNGVVVIDPQGNWVGPAHGVDWADLVNVPADLADGDQAEDTLGNLVCLNGQVAKWDGNNWLCDSDIDTNTQLSETEVVGFVSNAPIAVDLASGSTLGGESLVSVPSGMVGFFPGSVCPQGWSEFTSLQGRVVVGLPPNGVSAASVGSALGNQGTRSISNVVQHTHSVNPPTTQVDGSGANHSHSMSHTHSVNPPNTGTNSAGAHTHNLHDGVGIGDGFIGVNVGGGGHPGVTNQSGNGAALNTTSNGNHAHSVDIGGFNSGGSSTSQTGSTNSSHNHTLDIAAFNSQSSGTATVDVTMPYLQLLACQAP